MFKTIFVRRTNLREREKLFIKLAKGRTYQNWKEIPEFISLLKKKKTNKNKYKYKHVKYY